VRLFVVTRRGHRNRLEGCVSPRSLPFEMMEELVVATESAKGEEDEVGSLETFSVQSD